MNNKEAYLMIKKQRGPMDSDGHITDLYIAELEANLIPAELVEKLNKIYNYFGGRKNKMDKLFQECGEYRDEYLMSERKNILMPEKVTEICDVGSCFLQLYFNEPVIRETFNQIVDKTISKIDNNTYEKEKSRYA